jgi:catechol 2,3-dioxygenase-like lactoylglutathione lyase family enzyme
MIEGARYTHTNVIARDWRSLADFYTSVFGCTLVPPVRDYSGPTLEAGTGVPGSSLAGVHLRMPGVDAENGPTLEIFGYSIALDAPRPAINRPGWGHLAFEVASVDDALAEVLAAGGGQVGEVITLTTATGARVTMCYVTDPEGNIIELQSWA